MTMAIHEVKPVIIMTMAEHDRRKSFFKFRFGESAKDTSNSIDSRIPFYGLGDAAGPGPDPFDGSFWKSERREAN